MDAESDLDRLKRELEEKSRLLEESLERERNKTRTLSPEKYYVYLADEIESRKTFPEIARRYKRMAERIRGDPSARKFIDSLYDGFMYVPGNCLREALDRCEHSAIKNVLELCIKSRPLFAESVADKITDYLANLTLGNVALNFVDFLDQLRNDVLTIMRTKQSVHSREGCFGYITAVLLAGGALLSEDSTHRSLFGDFTTKNWAYLVNDENVLFVQQPDFKQAKRQRQLKKSTASRDRWMRLSILHSKPIFFVLFRESGFGDDMDRLHFQIPNQDFRPFP
jgi:hypothetical protein